MCYLLVYLDGNSFRKKIGVYTYSEDAFNRAKLDLGPDAMHAFEFFVYELPFNPAPPLGI